MRRFLFGAFALSLVLGMGGIAWADLVPGDAYHMANYGQVVVGGQVINGVQGGLFAYDFTYEPDGTTPITINYRDDYPEFQHGYVTEATKDYGVGDQYFLTFCLEMEEYIADANRGILNATGVLTTTTDAVYGGEKPDSDPICKSTAWLYYAFARGQLTGQALNGDFNFTSGGVGSDVDLLQKTIWFLEGELPSSFSLDDHFLAQVPTEFDTDWNSSEDYIVTEPIDREPEVGGDGSYEFYIYAVNSWKNSSPWVEKQDYLLMVADYKEGIVPEPSAFLVWAFGVLVAGVFYRRVR